MLVLVKTTRAIACLLLILAACDGGETEPAEDGSTPGTDAGPPIACESDADCDDGVFCNGAETCGGDTCAPGSSPCGGGEVCNEGASRCDPIGTGADGLPTGIPEPTFGWELDTEVDATIWVDNTNPACDDAGPGSEAVPFCDLFQGGNRVTYEAGDVVAVLGGPYVIGGDYTLTADGTEAAPVIIVGRTADRALFDGEGTRANFEWAGSYLAIEHLDFFHMTRHRVTADHFAFRDVAVHNPVDAFIDFNPVVSITGHDVLVERSEIFNNRRTTDTDSHGIQASEGSYNVWILDNELYNNNGDSFQACHMCFDTPPHHVYLGRNVMHDDRENGIDLKTIHDVVISENVLYGYGSSTTSNGDAMVIGSNGFDEAINQGPRRVWILNNEVRDSATGIRIEGSEDVWLIGNAITNVGVGLQIDDKPHREIIVAANTLRGLAAGDGVSVFGCRPSSLVIVNNVIEDPSERHLDMGACTAAVMRVENNLLYASGGGIAVRIDSTMHADLASLHGTSFASGNLDAMPVFEGTTLVPADGSPMQDAGTSLDAYYAAYVGAFGPPIDRDRAGTPRPSGAAEDIGAFERP